MKSPRSVRLCGLRWPLLLAALAGVACTDSAIHNEGVMATASGRFRLVVESDRTTLPDSHFLIDTVTGDLWALRGDETGTREWARVASGPDDTQKLALEQLLGRLD